MTNEQKPPIEIRKGLTWNGRPVWRWRCRVCIREKGRKPIGGDHRVVTFTGLWRVGYPSAFDRCMTAGNRHANMKHSPHVEWTQRVKETMDRLCSVQATPLER